MLSLTQYQIDAFSRQIFKGNPAAVIVLDAFLPRALMQSIAGENNLSETAFVTPKQGQPGHYNLRWFTPTVEIDFCGHATLASAHVLAAHLNAPRAEDRLYHFDAMIGALSVGVDGGVYKLNAPITSAIETPITPAIRRAFPVALQAAFKAGPNLYVVFDCADDITALAPDFAAIIPLSRHGVGITARNTDADKDYDCISRFFVPAEGIDEDPVTGSAHAAIGPYWARRLGRDHIRAYQASARGGYLDIELQSDGVVISGPAVTFSIGQIFVPDF